MFGGEMTPPDQMREAEARGEERRVRRGRGRRAPSQRSTGRPACEGRGRQRAQGGSQGETPALSLQGCEAEVSGCVFLWEVARLQQEFQRVLSECSRHSQGDRPKRFHWRAGR